MEYKQLGKTDLRVSRICFGTWAFGGDWGAFDENEAVGATCKALELGINFFDTAQAYGFGTAERLLSRALREEIRSRRNEVVLATKGGLRVENGKLLRDASRKWLRQGLEKSLENLGTDYVDLYQVHWPDSNTPMEETTAALEEFVHEGKVRYVGVSNFNAQQMAEFEKTRKLDALQPPYHMFRRDVEKGILPYCEAHGVGVLVYGPLAHGLLAGKYTPNKAFPKDDWRSRNEAFHGKTFRDNLEVVERLKEFAQARGHTVAELAIAWTLAKRSVDVAIVGARRPQQIVETASAVDFHLSDRDLREIDEILKDVMPTGWPTPEKF